MLQAFHSIAKCVAVLSLTNDADRVIKDFLSSLGGPKNTDSVQLFSLLSLGEIGRNQDLSSYKQVECKSSIIPSSLLS